MLVSPQFRFALLLSAIVLTASGFAFSADRWPAFQGPRATDLNAADLPLTWSPTESIAWKTSLTGYGQSSPVAWAGHIYVTSISGDNKEKGHVIAVDLRTGEKRWQHDFDTASQAASTNYVSKAAPTPVVDEQGVTSLFEGGDLIALSHEGEVRWRRNLVADYGAIESRHGLASSLEQDEQNVFVWIERQEDPYVLAVSKTNGETTWKANGLGVTSWSSPRLAPVADAAHLLLSGIGKIAGLDPRTGKRLWEFDDISGNSTPTPLPLGDGRFLIGATEGRGQEGGGNAAESNGLLQIERLDDGDFHVKYVWRAKRATSSFGSPIAHDGRAYFVNRSGVVYCLDLESGEELYAQRSSGSVWATPLGISDRIYLFGRDGATTVIKAGAKFERLAENELWRNEAAENAAGPASFGGPVLYAVIAVNDTLIARRGETLFAVRRMEP